MQRESPPRTGDHFEHSQAENLATGLLQLSTFIDTSSSYIFHVRNSYPLGQWPLQKSTAADWHWFCPIPKEPLRIPIKAGSHPL